MGNYENRGQAPLPTINGYYDVSMLISSELLRAEDFKLKNPFDSICGGMSADCGWFFIPVQSDYVTNTDPNPVWKWNGPSSNLIAATILSGTSNPTNRFPIKLICALENIADDRSLMRGKGHILDLYAYKDYYEFDEPHCKTKDPGILSYGYQIW
jgi:hypothetical protein